VEQILEWADTHCRRTGRWPTAISGPVAGQRGLRWSAVNGALRDGRHGLPGDSSLARLLADRRGRRTTYDALPLTFDQVLAWADSYRVQTENWPHYDSGPVPGASGETWLGLDTALRRGSRGLPGGSSLARLLKAERGVRNPSDLPRFTVRQIVAWARAHRRRTGCWPTRKSGTVEDASGETWQGVHTALVHGRRGLPGGTTLARVLATQCGVRNRRELPRLTVRQIVSWARVYRRRTGDWPNAGSGEIAGALGETWAAVEAALRQGRRGLRGGSSLTKVLSRQTKR
jgi:hypothetical protein